MATTHAPGPAHHTRSKSRFPAMRRPAAVEDGSDNHYVVPRLPVELLKSIFRYAAPLMSPQVFHFRARTLRSFSLVCHDWLAPAQDELFTHLVVTKLWQLEPLFDALEKVPRFASRVQSLYWEPNLPMHAEEVELKVNPIKKLHELCPGIKHISLAGYTQPRDPWSWGYGGHSFLNGSDKLGFGFEDLLLFEKLERLSCVDCKFIKSAVALTSRSLRHLSLQATKMPHSDYPTCFPNLTAMSHTDMGLDSPALLERDLGRPDQILARHEPTPNFKYFDLPRLNRSPFLSLHPTALAVIEKKLGSGAHGCLDRVLYLHIVSVVVPGSGWNEWMPDVFPNLKRVYVSVANCPESAKSFTWDRKNYRDVWDKRGIKIEWTKMRERGHFDSGFWRLLVLMEEEGVVSELKQAVAQVTSWEGPYGPDDKACHTLGNWNERQGHPRGGHFTWYH